MRTSFKARLIGGVRFSGVHVASSPSTRDVLITTVLITVSIVHSRDVCQCDDDAFIFAENSANVVRPQLADNSRRLAL
jgi:hypothetical protein